MLPAEPHCVAAAKAGVEQHIEPYALARADGPAALICRHMLFRPRNESVALPAGQVVDASRWVGFN